MDLTTLTPNSKTNALLKEHGFQPSEFPVDLRKQLVYADTISLEITVTNANSNTAKKQVVRNIGSGKILQKYKLLKYAAKKLAPTETNYPRFRTNLSVSSRRKGTPTQQKTTLYHFIYEMMYPQHFLENATLRRLQIVTSYINENYLLGRSPSHYLQQVNNLSKNSPS